MYKVNLESPIHVHFIGIGGISMSALAQLLLDRNFRVTGSDIGNNSSINKLASMGAHIYKGHHQDHITSDIDLVVYTVAVKLDNPEMEKAKKMDIPIIDRGTLLGQVMDGYENSVAVSGTHGKTTTTSMIAHILTSAKTEPTVMVGGILPLIGGNVAVGKSPYFVTEACEYFDSFHHFFPKIAVILNVEEDHMDYFRDLHHIHNSFHTFLENTKADGTIIINADIKNSEQILRQTNRKILNYSLVHRDCDFYGTNIVYNALGHGAFDVIYKEHSIGRFQLSVPGDHNISNALAAIATAIELGIDLASITLGLLAFTGTHRRFQYKGSLGGVHIVDDYAHHPTEIEATIRSTANMKFNKLWIVFQPHTYTRTKAFLDDFAKALSLADHVILMDIYSAGRETDIGDIHARDIQSRILTYGTPCEYFSSFDEISYHILTHCIPNDLLITMGAGDVYLLGESLLDS
ncbi:MAG: UDP-N-acetylmuramate--L-alanine ligase [Firmicutes bacterium HGW-Firmicutes-2]|jgi:UDP-N-acetylmuramate--alanine ligase|nr:MAG: UDP-N-acetylmuramate--L-alanine ligase [Firmicutes bacterium HGW-Firmicutes-2]